MRIDRAVIGAVCELLDVAQADMQDQKWAEECHRMRLYLISVLNADDEEE